jgi:ATP-dependent helicase/nuclease subunit A
MNRDDLLKGLDRDQVAAVRAEGNTVVSAGAGSGKTKVLASRFAWLVMEQNLKAENILTLTFTNKAANEMYDRIYRQLLEHQDNERARDAINDFYKANISTLDSFCSSVARMAARYYGISPDFTIDNEGVREMAVNESLPFVLEHRQENALRMLMTDKKIRAVAEELFADTMAEYSPISNPLDFEHYKNVQGAAILDKWNECLERVWKLTEGILRELSVMEAPSGTSYKDLMEYRRKHCPPAPDMRALIQALGYWGQPDPLLAEKIKFEAAAFFKFLNGLRGIRSINAKSVNLASVKEMHDELKGGLLDELETAAAFILQADITAGVFSLLDIFQKQFNQKKREAGLLSFRDVAYLAVDALKNYEDIRTIYKDSIRAVMIDEFQDNNSLQRDLVFLIAEKRDCHNKNIPPVEDLCPGKLFFVGDEKQSIYRFRGADVSVFRKLAGDLQGASPDGSICLSHNYRSTPPLIDAFNWIFGGLLPDPGFPAETGAGVFLPGDAAIPYEASYARIYPRDRIIPPEQKEPAVFFCFLDKDEAPGEDPFALSVHETEAAFIAAKIRELVQSGAEIVTRDGTKQALEYPHIAVLQRSLTHQAELERQFRSFGIPYSAEDPAGLFNDAPVNDLYAFLRLMVYPDDRGAYAAVLRSPLTGLSDSVLAFCMLNYRGIPFEEIPGAEFSETERKLYRQAGDLYRSLLEASRDIGVAEILNRLWYDTGYRYETLWNSQAQIYGELFDFFFELARKSDERSRSLADFLDYFDDSIRNDERIKDLNIPIERTAGVRLMSIHKSKGLEFPVVFVYGAGNSAVSNRNDKGIFWDEQWGVTLNLPQAEELSTSRGNYFYNFQKEADLSMQAAELRRLLYVAMTRAEYRLYVTGILPKRTQGEDDTGSLEERLLQLSGKERSGKSLPTFLELLLPAVTAEVPPGTELFKIEKIPVLTREELRDLTHSSSGPEASLREAVEAAAPYYSIPAIESPPSIPVSIPASSLHVALTGEDTEVLAGGEEALDLLIRKAGVNVNHFGTLVHAFLEAHFSGGKLFIPPEILAILDERYYDEILKETRKTANSFIDSELGALAGNALWIEPEFPVMTLIRNLSAGRPLWITGQIDLLFETEGTIHIVDFKTDRLENPTRHLGQLAVYYRAVSDIYPGASSRPWIFYLRSGKPCSVAGLLETIQIEDLAENYLKEQVKAIHLF